MMVGNLRTVIERNPGLGLPDYAYADILYSIVSVAEC